MKSIGRQLRTVPRGSAEAISTPDVSTDIKMFFVTPLLFCINQLICPPSPLGHESTERPHSAFPMGSGRKGVATPPPASGAPDTPGNSTSALPNFGSPGDHGYNPIGTAVRTGEAVRRKSVSTNTLFFSKCRKPEVVTESFLGTSFDVRVVSKKCFKCNPQICLGIEGKCRIQNSSGKLNATTALGRTWLSCRPQSPYQRGRHPIHLVLAQSQGGFRGHTSASWPH